MSLLPEPGRRKPVHHEHVERINRATIVFLTVCTKGRKAVLNNARAHEVMIASWRDASRWIVGRYVILPDHLHLFCAPASEVPLDRWVAYWKNQTARLLKEGDDPFWQRDFWDIQLRATESYEAQWEYVRNNPVRHNLVSSAEAWPYQGEVHDLGWHD